MQSKDTRIIGKVAFELRLTPRIDTLVKMYEAAQPLTNEFKTWKHAGNTVVLEDHDRKLSLGLTPDRWNLIFEDVHSTDDVLKIALPLYANLMEQLGHDGFTKIGLRMLTYQPTEMSFSEIAKLFELSFYSDAMRKLLPFSGKSKDHALVVDTSEQDWSLHFQIGPVHRAELATSKLIYEVRKVEPTFFPEAAYFCDVHAARPGRKVADLQRLTQEAIKMLDQHSDTVLGFWSTKR